MPFNPQVILSKLNMKLWTLTLPTNPSANTNLWVSQTPYNPTDTLSQTILVKDRITCYQGNSLILIFETVVVLAKGTELLAHEMILLSAEIRILRKANKVLSKRRRIKKTRVRQGGILIIEDTQDVLAQKEAEE
jgi:hypothetical protein